MSDPRPPARKVAQPDTTVDMGPTQEGQPRSPGAAPDLPERVGSYRILKKLGQGGMGVVYLAEDPALNRRVALKVMVRAIAEHPQAKERFLREARATAALKHDHIVTIYQVGEEDGLPFLAMEYLEGMSLEDWLRRGQKVKLRHALRIGAQIARGLAAAHAKGMVHRDVKPANVWLEAPSGRVKILDFGLARVAEGDAHLTHSGAVLGTPAYMAPEQANGLPVDHRADLFSLGCVLYRLCTLLPPFTGPTALATMMAASSQAPRPVTELRPDVPAELAHLIDRLLAKSPEQRPAHTRAIADELSALEHQLGRLKKSTPHLTVGAEVAAPAVPIEPTDPTDDPWAELAITAVEPPPVAKATKAGVPRLWLWLAVGALMVVVGGGLIFSAFRPSAPKGTLVIEADDPNVEIVVKKDGAIVREHTALRELELPAGEYEVELAIPKTGVRLVPPRFAIGRNARVLVRLLPERTEPKQPKPKPTAPTPTTPLPPELTLALPPIGEPLPPPTVALDQLDAAQIPPADRFSWQPKELVAILGSHRGKFGDATRFAVSGDGRLVASINPVRVWDGETLNLKWSLFGGTCYSVALSPDGKTLAAGVTESNNAYEILRWRLGGAEPEPLPPLPHPSENGGITALGFSPDGKLLAAGTGAGIMRLWDLGEAGTAPIAVLQAPDVPVNSAGAAALEFGGHRLAIGLSASPHGPRVDVWDLNGTEAKRRFSVPMSAAVLGAPFAFTPTGDAVAVWSLADQTGLTVTVWDVTGTEPKSRGTAKIVGGGAGGLAFSGDGHELYITNGNRLEVWGVEEKSIHKLRERPSSYTVVKTVTGGKRLVTGGPGMGVLNAESLRTLVDGAQDAAANPCLLGDKAVTVDGTQTMVWALDGPRPRLLGRSQPFWGGTGRVMSPNGTTIMTWPNGNNLSLGTLEGGKVRARVQAVQEGLREGAWSPDGRVLATFSVAAPAVELWDVTRDPSVSGILDQLATAPVALAFAPTGRRLAVLEADGTVHLWDLSAPKTPPRAIPAETQAAYVSVAFTADGQHLLVSGSTGVDPTGKVYRIDLTKPNVPAMPLQGVTGGQLTLSPDGRTLVVVGRYEANMPTNRLTWWDTATGRKRGEWRATCAIGSAQFAADGRHLLVANADNTAYILRLAPATGP